MRSKGNTSKIPRQQQQQSSERPRKRRAALDEKILKKAAKYVKLSKREGEERGGHGTEEEEQALDLQELSVPTINVDLAPRIKLRKPRWDKEKLEAVAKSKQGAASAPVTNTSDDSKTKAKKKKKKKNRKKGDQLPDATVEQKHEAEALKFLQKWDQNKDEWKFEKLKQVWLLKNAFNPALIDDDNFKILVNYVGSVHGHARKGLESDTKKIIKHFEENISNRLISKPTPDELGKYERARQIIQMLSDD